MFLSPQAIGTHAVTPDPFKLETNPKAPNHGVVINPSLSWMSQFAVDNPGLSEASSPLGHNLTLISLHGRFYTSMGRKVQLRSTLPVVLSMNFLPLLAYRRALIASGLTQRHALTLPYLVLRRWPKYRELIEIRPTNVGADVNRLCPHTALGKDTTIVGHIQVPLPKAALFSVLR